MCGHLKIFTFYEEHQIFYIVVSACFSTILQPQGQPGTKMFSKTTQLVLPLHQSSHQEHQHFIPDQDQTKHFSAVHLKI